MSNMSTLLNGTEVPTTFACALMECLQLVFLKKPDKMSELHSMCLEARELPDYVQAVLPKLPSMDGRDRMLDFRNVVLSAVTNNDGKYRFRIPYA